MGPRALVLPYGVLRGAARDAFLAQLRRGGIAEPLAWLEDPGALDRLADEIARRDADLLVIGGTTQSLRARALAPSLPIVAWGVASELGGRPANTTGVTPSRAIYARRLDLVAAVIPHARTIALAYDAGYAPGHVALERTTAEVASRALDARVYEIREAAAIVPAMERMARDHVDAVLVMNSTVLGREEMATTALGLRLPLFAYDWTTRAGGLASVTPDFRQVATLMAGQVARIANGERADDIPMIAHDAFWTVVNVATAAALGITVPQEVLASASEIVR